MQCPCQPMQEKPQHECKRGANEDHRQRHTYGNAEDGLHRDSIEQRNQCAQHGQQHKSVQAQALQTCQRWIFWRLSHVG